MTNLWMSSMDPDEPAIDQALVRGLREVIAGGDAVLFTGAGFSVGARDMGGDPLPTSEVMRRELYALLFGDEEPDDSTLADLYDVALARAPDELERYLARRLRIGHLCDVERYAVWFSLPWRRVYTLNVDDLETVLARLSPLSRPLRSVSIPHEAGAIEEDALAVIHLNGAIQDGAASLTFSTLQYAARLCGQDPVYRALAEDLDRRPFVFVGTTLDEVVLWQHLELHKRRGGQALRHRSYLIARTLSRARRELLAELGLIWIPSTQEAVADDLSSRLDPAVQDHRR